MKKLRKKEEGIKLIILALIQILLLVNTAVSQSHSINEIQFYGSNLAINIDLNHNLIPEIAGFLSWIFSVKQIEIVSAQ